MAYSKAQLEALAASLLASSQPIAAVQHRAQVQTLIDEMFSAQSRGNILAGVQSTATQDANDTALIFRNGQAFRLPLSVFAGSTLEGLGDVFIQNPGTGDIEALVYDPLNSRWINSSLDGLFATQDELNNVLASISNKVSYNVADSKNATERHQARTNIGSTSATPQIIATAGAIDNLAITSNHLVFTGSNVVLSGIVAGLDGQEVTILNTNAIALSILSQSTLSDANNRIIDSLLVPQFSVVRLKYRATTNRWVIEALGVNDGRYLRKDINQIMPFNLRFISQAALGINDYPIRVMQSDNTTEVFHVRSQGNVLVAGIGNAGQNNAILNVNQLPAGTGDNRPIIIARRDTGQNAWLLRNDGRVIHYSRSGDSIESTRRDELYLNYSQTVATGGTINDLEINADTKLLVLTNASILTGVVGEEGRLLRVMNGGVSNIIIRNNGTESLAANRFQLDNSFVLPSGRVVTFIYSGGGWRLADVGAGYVTLATDQTITGTKIFATSTLRTSASGTSAVTIYRNTSGSSISSSDANNFGFNNSNNIYFSKPGSNNIGIFAFNNTEERTYTLPDASGDIVLGSGTTNFLAKFTAAGTIGNSLIFDDGTNVGIGTNSPTATLDVRGLQVFQGTTASDTAPLGSELATTGSGTNWVGTSFATGYTHEVGSTEPLTTSIPAVSGTYYQLSYTVTGRTAGSFTINYGGTSTSGITATGVTGPLATSTNNLQILPTTDFNGTIVLSVRSIGTSSATTTFRDSNGNVSMEIRAASVFSNTLIGNEAGRRITTGNLNSFFGVNAGRNNTTGGGNSFVGAGAGENNTTGSNNSFVGVNAGFSNTTGIFNSFFGVNAGRNNTTGVFNSFFGMNAGFINTTGSNNSFVGLRAGFSNTTGSDNSFVGAGAGENNTTGSNNSFVGSGAGRNNTTGVGNSFVGVNAGQFLANGSTPLTIVSNSVFIGNDTRANANNQTNQIVIGHNAVGMGSNSVVLGNGSITTTVLRGNVLIGTTSQLTGGGSLQVNGDINASNSSAHGIILQSPDGNRWRVRVANGGVISITAI